MPAPQDIERAAQQAAARVKAHLIQMLTDGEIGEVAVIVGRTQLVPQKRELDESPVIRIARGEHVAIETVR